MEKRCAERAVLLFLLIFLLSISIASAEYKELMHDDWHKHDDNFTVDGTLFKIRAGGDPTKVILSINNNVVVIENNTCVDKMNMSLCLKDIRSPAFDLHKIIDIEDYEYYVEIWYYLANLTIEKQLDERTILVGQKIRVEVKIQNDGSQPARGIYFRDIYFSDSYPDFFISNVYGCSFNKHNVTWTGILRPTQVKICSYDLEAVKSTTFSSVAKVTYLVGIANRTRTASSDVITLVVPEYELVLETDLNSTAVNVGDEVEFNATLNNSIHNETFNNVALSIEIPKGLELMGYSGGVSPLGSMLRWTGKIEKAEKKNFSAKFRVIYSGNNSLKTNVNYNIGHLVRLIDKLDNVEGKIDKLNLQYTSLTSDVKSGSPARFVVNIINPGSRYEFKNINASISTNLPMSFDSSSFKEIGKKQFKNIVTRNFTIPVVEDITHYKITFNADYETEYGQKINLNETKTITVNPEKKPEQQQLKEKEGGEEAANKRTINRGTIREEIEKMGTSKFVFGFIAFVLIFLFSSLHFIRKMVTKVQEYEGYEK